MEATLRRQSTAAAEALLAADSMRRRGEADVITALCAIAETYRVDEGELLEVLTERFVSVGGVGTPTVSEFLRLELAGLLRCSPDAALAKLADAINLKYRHPRLYEAVRSYDIEPARALRAARMCRDLHPMLADPVTAEWLHLQAGHSWAAAFALLTRLILEANPEEASRKETNARGFRGVWTWGLADGAMNLTGRLDVLDAKFFDARLDELARHIASTYPDLTQDQRRAKAVGVLAHPAEALRLLQEAYQPTLGLTPAGTTAQASAPHEEPAPSAAPQDGHTPPPGHGPDCIGPHCGRVTVPPARLRPRLGLAVHIHSDAVGELTGAARVERAGWITAELLAELLGDGINGSGVQLSVQPVIDLPRLEPADAYVPPPRMERAIRLAFPTEAFPYSNRASAGLDLDHTDPYRPGRRGQTRLGNLAPLTRGVHRPKTAGFWVMDQVEPGRILWTSPLGYRYETTPMGTGLAKRAGPLAATAV